ncbi:vanillate O-demethylase [Gluconacetobacter sacchari DSM 12717]|uniref:Vanillate O-demethylase n=1 Tax=Gluconacetobacter sacchari DSM 12717 TaxID=1307940 RepID=A0ABQ0P4N7_9PROT|nr:PDR/VanB family oxidoreductase [Gluconacetobacter sacchari]GBQ22178.1 vanillate O-demethylase [Gluconacetobacter sacchari DSM 12717]
MSTIPSHTIPAPRPDRITVVVETVALLGQVVLFDLRPQSGLLPAWQAGAHVDLFLGDGLVRQYSLCGDPARQDRYRLAVLLEPDSRGGSRAVHARVRPGARLATGAPRNLFPLRPGSGPVVLVGGGIGVTPLVAMAHALHDQGRDFVLHYVARDPVFAPLLRRTPFAERVRVHDRSQADAPRFDPSVVPAAHAGTAGLSVYVCGPPGLMEDVARAAGAAGVPPDAIHREAFSARPVAAGGAFEVLAARAGLRVAVGGDEPITAALARAGLRVPVSCEQGICGTCVVTMLEGEADHRDSYLTDDERTDQIALCCSRARSPLLVIDL